MNDLANTIGAPLIESYGMTEAAHQMASIPLPLRTLKNLALLVSQQAPMSASRMRPWTGSLKEQVKLSFLVPMSPPATMATRRETQKALLRLKARAGFARAIKGPLMTKGNCA